MNENITKAIIDMSEQRVVHERLRADKREPFVQTYDGEKYYDHVLNLRKNGYSVIENFYSQEQCKKLRDEIDKLHKEHTSELWTDDQKADIRLFGSERYSTLIKQFYEDPLLQNLGEHYFDGKLWNSNTLAAKISATSDNLGSGGGWHRDSNHFEFKAIVYLCDVNIENGPFQIIEGSHWFKHKLEDMVTMNVDSTSTRFSDEQIKKVIDQDPKKYKIMTAKAGTLLLVDTTTLHTGMPLVSGNRYTLFNYYFPSYDNKNHRLKTMGIIN